MRTIKIKCFDNGKTTLTNTDFHFSGENKASKVIIDFSETTNKDYFKFLDIELPDNTYKRCDLGTSEIVEQELTNEVTMSGRITFAPFVLESLTVDSRKIEFHPQSVTVRKQITATEGVGEPKGDIWLEFTADINSRQYEVESRQDSVENALEEFISDQVEKGVIATNIEAKLNAKEQEYAPRLTEVENDVDVIVKQNNKNSVSKRALISFIVDDGARGCYTILKPVFESKGAKYCIAARGDFVNIGAEITPAEYLELENAGHQIISHSQNHTDFTLLTEEQIELECLNSIASINALGIPCEGIAYPFGHWDEKSLKVVRKYFKYAFATNSEGYLINNEPLDQFVIPRATILKADQTPYSLDEIKKNIDQVYHEKGWLVYCTHSYEFEGDNAGNITLLEQVLDYINSLGIPVVTPKTAIEEKGNYMDVGNFKTDYVKIGKNGGVFGKNLEKKSFETSSFPFTIDTPLSYYPNQKITIKNFVSPESGTSGFGAGTLITYRLSDISSVPFQIFHPASPGNTIEKRRWFNGAWTGFETFVPNKTIYQTINFGVIPANRQVESTRTISGIRTGQNVIVTPTVESVDQDLMWSAYISANDTLKIRVRNFSTEGKTIGTQWKITLIG